MIPVDYGMPGCSLDVLNSDVNGSIGTPIGENLCDNPKGELLIASPSILTNGPGSLAASAAILGSITVLLGIYNLHNPVTGRAGGSVRDIFD